MLTPTEVHFLVGLLTQISRPGGIEIELGEMVFDVEAEEKRDVDIVIKCTNSSGEISVFEGIEVKDHKRPLDTTHVEQLCKKLSDMPSLTYRGIVSSSGYTKPATLKARKMGIELYELKDWPVPRKLGLITLSDELVVNEGMNGWHGKPQIQIVSPLKRREAGEIKHNLNTHLFDNQGNQIEETPTLGILVDKCQSLALHKINKEATSQGYDKGDIREVSYNFPLKDHFLHIERNVIPLSNILISGEIICVERKITPKYKGLYIYEAKEPFISCAIFEMSFRNLAGFTIDHNNRLSLITIPTSIRDLNKIYRIQLQR